MVTDSTRTQSSRSVFPRWAWVVGMSAFCGAATAQDPEPQGPIVIATREAPPFAMRDEAGQWRGISIELVEQLRSDLKGEREIVFRDMPLADMLDAVASGEVDLAAAALTVNYEREQRLDFSHPYYTGGLGIAVRLDGQNQSLWGLVRAVLSPTFLRIVAGLIVTMLVVGVAIYLCERRANREQFGGSAIRGVLSGLWWSAVTLTTVGYGDKVPKSTWGRVIATVWMFSGLFIIASFTAAITSTLTLTELRSRISGPNDLSRVRVATVSDSTSHNYLRGRGVRARGYPDVASALEALAEGDCEAVVYDAVVLRYQVQHQHAEELYVLSTEFEFQDYALALPPDSPLREPVNQALLRIKATEPWQDLLDRLLGDRTN